MPNRSSQLAPSVLLVDDSRFIIKAVSSMLAELGIQDLTVAMSGAEALSRLKDRNFDLILTDLQMPEMDGIELLRQMAERDVESAIILISALDERVLNTVKALGIAHKLEILGLMKKPFAVEQLGALVSKYRLDKVSSRKKSFHHISKEDIAAALKNNEFCVAYQPQVEMSTKAVVGVECLLRWTRAGEMVPPAAFIPIAEREGMVSQLTDLVCASAMREIGSLVRDGVRVRLAINFSVNDLNDLSIVERLTRLVHQHGMSPKSVLLEVTESQIIQDIRIPLEVLTRLRLSGFEVSVDDFGTGAASFQQLQRIPCTELKIDQAFVRGAANDETCMAMLRAGVEIGKKLGVCVVGEGIELQSEWDLLASLGCDVAQGYLISPPLFIDELDDWLVQYAFGVK